MALLRRRKTIGPAFGYQVLTVPPVVGSSLAFGLTAAPTVLTSAFQDAVFTFSSVSIGAAASDRVVVVYGVTDGFRTVTSMTLNGSSMSLAAAIDGTNTNAIWYMSVASGTTATIVMTISAAGSYSGIMVGRLVGCSPTPVATLTWSEPSGWDPHTMPSAVTVPSGGAAVICGLFHPASNLPHSWSPSPPIVDDGVDPGGAYRTNTDTFLVMGHSVTAGSLTPSMSSTSGANDFGYGGNTLVEVVWGP